MPLRGLSDHCENICQLDLFVEKKPDDLLKSIIIDVKTIKFDTTKVILI